MSLSHLQVVIVARRVHRFGLFCLRLSFVLVASLAHVCKAAAHVSLQVGHLHCTFLFNKSQRICTPKR